MDYFVEIGWIGYQAIQPSAGMDIRELKKDYGERLCLWTGASIENLVSGEPKDVRKDVRYSLEYGKPGGGFIFGTSHSVGVGSKYDNFMAALDEFDKRASY